ncbi:hypothetical protein D3C80_1389250 [compost metagenome]
MGEALGSINHSEQDVTLRILGHMRETMIIKNCAQVSQIDKTSFVERRIQLAIFQGPRNERFRAVVDASQVNSLGIVVAFQDLRNLVSMTHDRLADVKVTFVGIGYVNGRLEFLTLALVITGGVLSLGKKNHIWMHDMTCHLGKWFLRSHLMRSGWLRVLAKMIGVGGRWITIRSWSLGCNGEYEAADLDTPQVAMR